VAGFIFGHHKHMTAQNNMPKKKPFKKQNQAGSFVLSLNVTRETTRPLLCACDFLCAGAQSICHDDVAASTYALVTGMLRFLLWTFSRRTHRNPTRTSHVLSGLLETTTGDAHLSSPKNRCIVASIAI
jgi:hypothetical protein